MNRDRQPSKTTGASTAEQAKSLEMRATAATRERKRRLWNLIQQHDPGMAAFIEALSKTPGPWSDVQGGKSIARVGFNGEWTDGRAPEVERDLSAYFSARRKPLAV